MNTPVDVAVYTLSRHSPWRKRALLTFVLGVADVRGHIFAHSLKALSSTAFVRLVLLARGIIYKESVSISENVPKPWKVAKMHTLQASFFNSVESRSTRQGG